MDDLGRLFWIFPRCQKANCNAATSIQRSAIPDAVLRTDNSRRIRPAGLQECGQPHAGRMCFEAFIIKPVSTEAAMCIRTPLCLTPVFELAIGAYFASRLAIETRKG